VANRTSGTVPQTGNAVIIAEDRQQHDYREQIILGGPGSGSEVTPSGRTGAGSRHKKAVTVQQRVGDAHWSLRMALAWITTAASRMSSISSTEDGRPPRQQSAICYLPCDPAN
jgi:hypothetical protein